MGCREPTLRERHRFTAKVGQQWQLICMVTINDNKLLLAKQYVEDHGEEKVLLTKGLTQSCVE